MIIPLKYKQYDNDLRSIRMDHEKYGSCIVCFCDFKEVEELIHEGWKILDGQKTIDDWIKGNYNDEHRSY